MEEFDWIHGALLPYTNFTIFLVLLIYFARKPLAGIVQDRYQKYVDLHAEAKQAYETAKEKHDELQQKLAGLQKEIDELNEISIQNAKHEYDAMVAQAKELGAHIIDEARMIADAEVEAAREQIKKEIITQLTDNVQQKISKDVDATRHKEIIARQTTTVEGLPFEGANV